jgi:hypothetical protein
MRRSPLALPGSCVSSLWIKSEPDPFHPPAATQPAASVTMRLNKEMEMPILLWLLGIPIPIIILLLLLWH